MDVTEILNSCEDVDVVGALDFAADMAVRDASERSCFVGCRSAENEVDRRKDRDHSPREKEGEREGAIVEA